MHHTSRQGKFHTKLESRTKDKSSLPQIDPFHGNSTKYGDCFGYKEKNGKDIGKIVKDRAHDPFSSTRTHLKAKDIDQYINPLKMLSQQQNERLNNNPNNQKKPSLNQQKQLMTADTIRAEPNYYQTISIGNSARQPQGLDMWTLNHNLKQFSETRKLPFYSKGRQEERDKGEKEDKIISKVRTQDIRSMYKIYSGGDARVINSERQRSEAQLNYKKLPVEQVKKIKLTQKDAKSHSTINNTKLISPLGNTLYGTLPVRKHHSNLDSTYYKKQSNHNSYIDMRNGQSSIEKTTAREVNPYLRTFINGSHLKRENSNRNIHILEMGGGFGGRGKAEQGREVNVRRNRFEVIDNGKKEVGDHTDNYFLSKLPSKSLNSPINSQPNHQQQQQTSSQTSQPPSPHTLTTSLPLNLPPSLITTKNPQKHQHYQYLRSIQRINKSLLKSSDHFLQQYHTFASMPNSKIEFYVDSLGHPEVGGTTAQYKSTWRGEGFEDEFWFAEADKAIKKKEVSVDKNKKSNVSKNNKVHS